MGFDLRRDTWPRATRAVEELDALNARGAHGLEIGGEAGLGDVAADEVEPGLRAILGVGLGKAAREGIGCRGGCGAGSGDESEGEREPEGT